MTTEDMDDPTLAGNPFPTGGPSPELTQLVLEQTSLECRRPQGVPTVAVDCLRLEQLLAAEKQLKKLNMDGDGVYLPHADYRRLIDAEKERDHLMRRFEPVQKDLAVANECLARYRMLQGMSSSLLIALHNQVDAMLKLDAQSHLHQNRAVYPAMPARDDADDCPF